MLIFEKSRPGRGCDLLPASDVEIYLPEEKDKREQPLHLPELSEGELSRHYTELAKKSHGVNDGFYPLGSCTMKYNPKINEDMASLPGFTEIHPLQPEHTVQGCLEVIGEIENSLCEITGMDRMTLQPAAGAHGEFTGLASDQGLSRKPIRREAYEDSCTGFRTRNEPGKCSDGRI